MREPVRDFVRICAETLPILEPIYEFGAMQVPGGGRSDMRPLFPGKEYIGADLRPGRGVDEILDLHDIALPDEWAGTVLVLDTLEHVECPRTAIREVYRVLHPDGLCILSTVMLFHVHSKPDYWRFTPEGLGSLFQPFPNWTLWTLGRDDFPHTLIVVACKTGGKFTPAFERAIPGWKNRWGGR